jgi:hypothetical protein
MCLATVLVAALLTPSGLATTNATPHSPRDGASFRVAQDIFFDWRWGPGEYWGTVYVSRSRAMRNPHRVDDWGAASNAYTVFSLNSESGTWYWQVCAVHVRGEDDKCSFTGPVRRLIVKPRKLSYSFSGHRGQNDDGADSIVLRVITRNQALLQDSEYQVCWKTISGTRCTDEIDGLGVYITYIAAPRTDYAIPVTSRNVINGQFTAWLVVAGKKVATYTTTV